MRRLLLIVSLAFFISCNQSTEKSKSDNRQDSTIVIKSDFKVVDSTYSLIIADYNYVLDDTTYFFDLPDSLHQRKEYILKDVTVEVLKRYNGFAFADYTMPSDKQHMIGWLKAGSLKRILFTPPKVVH
jgi:hypothetical protein